MRHVSTLAWRTWPSSTQPWHGVVPDTESDDAVYVYRMDGEDDADTSQLTLARLSDAGTDELAVLSVACAPPTAPAVADFRLLADGGMATENVSTLCIVTGGGDIVLLPLRDDDAFPAPADVVGSVEAGILAAAWSPEEDVLALITGESTPRLLLMTKEFDVMHEAALATDAFGDDQPVNVGWGSKSTQFHGSEGKQAAIKAAQAPAEGDPRGPLTPDDDGRPRISWRSDGTFFIVSSVEMHVDGTRHRILRTFTRTGSLSATSDPSVRGITQVLTCRPIGNLIATSQRMGGEWAPGRAGRHDIVFFERNGLRHGEFSLYEDDASLPTFDTATSSLPPFASLHTIHAVAWNVDGSILAVHLSRDGRHVLQLWTTGNYHWYLKQELTYDVLHAFTWHSEHALTLYVAHTHVEKRTMWLETPCSQGARPHDAACVAVVDGAALMLTPFRLQNVPPPMCAMAIWDAPLASPSSSSTPPSPPMHVAWTTAAHTDGTTSDYIALLYPRGHIHVWRVPYGVLGASAPRPRPTYVPERVTTMHLPATVRAFQVALAYSDAALYVAALGMEEEEPILYMASTSDVQFEPSPLESQAPFYRLVSVPGRIAFAVHDASGDVMVHSPASPPLRLDPLPSFCAHLVILEMDDTFVPLGLASDGRLLLSDRILAKDATSFTTTDRLVVWTTQTHEAYFLPRMALTEAPHIVALGRRVERGSRLVAAVPSAMALVLQMPRGNLETVYPRPMVLDVIRDALQAHEYGTALRLCRSHRVDLNLLHDHDPAAFLEHVSTMVSQVANVDHINLFLSSLRNEDVTATLYRPWDPSQHKPMPDLDGKVNRVCDALLATLQEVDQRRYLSSILTAHVRKVPADYEAGLRVLRSYMDTDVAVADEACKYIIFLVNADELYKVALGMYDFALALLIAQHSPRDPREYVPFLRSLRAKEPEAYQRFCIDDHLGRHAKALQWLSQAGDVHTDEAMAYMVEHKLYREGLLAWAKEPAHLREAYKRFAEYLGAHQRPAEAATAYQLAGDLISAVQSYKEADQWRQALTVAMEAQYSTAEMQTLARAISEQLEEQHKYDDAARVLLQVQDTEAGIAMLCRANAFVDAQLCCATHQRMDMVETHIAPAALEHQAALLEEADEIEAQLTKQVQRLHELDAKRTQDPAAFYVEEESRGLDNIDVMSDVSQVTQFTRYTTATSVAPTMSTLSLGSKRSSRHKAKAKKEEKKKNAGKKGSVYEEGYLHDSLQKLLQTRLGQLQRGVARLLPILATLGEKHRTAAKTLQSRLLSLEKRVAEAKVDLDQRFAAQEQDRFELMQTLATQVAQLAHAPGAGDSASAVLSTLWRWRQSQAPKPTPTVSNETWKLHLWDEPSSTSRT